MRRVLTILVCLAAVAGVACAQNGKFGLHGAYSAGGDVEEASAGLGAQFVATADQNVSLEFAVTAFSDDELLLESIVALALTGRVEAPLGETSKFYFGVGVSFNVIGYDNDGHMLGPLYEVEIDDAVGYHASAGFEFEVNESMEFFIDYRHTIMEIEGDVIFLPTGSPSVIYPPIKDDYNYGLVRVGFNVVLGSKE